MYNGRLSARNAGLRRTIEALLDRLVAIMNGGQELATNGHKETSAKPSTKAHAGQGQQVAAPQSPPGPRAGEIELWDCFDSVRNRLEQLRYPNWTTLTVQKGENGKFRVKVTL